MSIFQSVNGILDSPTYTVLNPEILYSASKKSEFLSWTHYRVLLQAHDNTAKFWFDSEALKGHTCAGMPVFHSSVPITGIPFSSIQSADLLKVIHVCKRSFRFAGEGGKHIGTC